MIIPTKKKVNVPIVKVQVPVNLNFLNHLRDIQKFIIIQCKFNSKLNIFYNARTHNPPIPDKPEHLQKC